MLRRTFLSMPLFAASGAAPLKVIAHRAAHAGHPENSLAAVRAGIAMGVDYVELDVRTAADGTLVLKHDALAPGDVGLARFDEALALLAPSKTDLYLDWKAATAEALVASLRRHGMTQRAHKARHTLHRSTFGTPRPSGHPGAHRTTPLSQQL